MIRATTRAYRRRAALFAGLAAAALTTGLTAASTAQAQAQAPAPHAIDLPAGPLDTALRRLAAETHEQLLFSPALVAGRQAPAVAGRLTADEALRRLLAASGIVAERTGPAVLVLRAAAAPIPSPAAARQPADGAVARRPFDADPAPGAAAAPLPTAPPETAATTTVAEVEVTGSHLRGVTDTPSPVLTVDRADLQRSGYATVAEALQTLPQNFSGAGAEVSTALATDRASGNSFYATGLNLRGLGPNATLTLINGRRLAGTGNNGDFADLSTLPSAAVERVEVLLDGASALYGSDAVGGVVNVIMRRRYDGAETRVSDGVATRGGPAQLQVSQTFGRTWSGGGLALAFEHDQRGELLARDRSFSATADLRAEGGTDHRVTFAHPGNILNTDPATAAAAPFWAIPHGQNGVGLQPSQLILGGGNLQEPLAQSALLPRQVTDSAYLSLVQSVGSRLELSADVTYGRRRFRLPTGTVSSIFSVSRANPFYVAPTGAASEFIEYAFSDDLPPSQLKGDSVNLAASAGAELRLAHDWQISAYGAYAEDHSRTAQTGLLNSSALAEALGNAPDNPATPYSASRDGFFNPFWDGRVNSPTVTGFIGSGYSTSDTQDRVTSGDLKADGPLLTLPGGQLRAAVGLAVRRETFDQGGVSFTSGISPAPKTPTSAGRTVTAAYAELRAPLLGAESPVGALDLSLAGRLEHYSDFGTTKNPKLGVIWTPMPDLRLRASYGRSFRAPSLPEVFGQQFFAPNRLPKGAAGSVEVILLQGGNPHLTPETARSWSVGFDWTPSQVPGLKLSAGWFHTRFTNRIDQPVRLVLGTVLTDPAYASFVSFISPATNPADLARVQALIAAPQNLGLGAFAPTQYAAIVDARYVNTGSLEVAGLDAQATYAWRLGGTDLQLSGSGAYLDRYDVGVTPTSTPIDKLNVANFPVRFRGRAALNASRGLLSGQIALNYVNRYHGPTGASIGAQLTTDLQLRARAPDGGRWAGLSAVLSVRNLFDRNPPFYDSPAAVAFDPANADPIGRFVSLQLIKAW